MDHLQSGGSKGMFPGAAGVEVKGPHVIGQQIGQIPQVLGDKDPATGRKQAFGFAEEEGAFRIIPDFMGGQNQKYEIAAMVRQR